MDKLKYIFQFFLLLLPTFANADQGTGALGDFFSIIFLVGIAIFAVTGLSFYKKIRYNKKNNK